MHQGFRLKNFIEKSGKKVSDIVKFSKVSNGTLYNYYQLEDLERKKIQPILDAIGVTYDDFLGVKKENPCKELEARVKELEAENVTLMKDKIILLEQINELQKDAKKIKLVR